jgi:glycosyltransferase involved in cell wall biosynthesis
MKLHLAFLFFLSFFPQSRSFLDHRKRKIDHEVAWYAPFYSGGGYCSEARSYVQALVSVGYTNFTVHQHGDSWNENFIRGQNEKENLLMSQHDDTYGRRKSHALISVCHSEPGAWYVPTPRYNTFQCPDCAADGPCYKIGRTMFETDSIPSGWLERLDQMNEIWVPTEESKQIFLKSGLSSDKLRVIEETVDETFYSNKRQGITQEMKKKRYDLKSRFPELLSINRNDTFIFLFVGKFELRKGIDLLIRGYFEEFSLSDSVLLLFLTSAYHSSEDFDVKIQEILIKNNLLHNDERKNPLPKYMILSDIHQDAMPLLYSLAHVLVSHSFPINPFYDTFSRYSLRMEKVGEDLQWRQWLVKHLLLLLTGVD